MARRPKSSNRRACARSAGANFASRQDCLRKLDLGAVLQVPGVGVMAIEQRSKQPDMNNMTRTPGPSKQLTGFVGMDPAVGAVFCPAIVARQAHRANGRCADRGGCQLPPSHVPALSAAPAQISPWKVRLMTFQLLLPGQADEVHRIAGDPDGQLRVFVRVLHRILQRLRVEAR